MIAAIDKIPFFHSYDAGSQRLVLKGATYFPLELLEFRDEIEILDASQGTLNSLPDDFAELSKLRIAFFSKNQFEVLPAVLGRCANLTTVGFKSCRIRELPCESLPKKLRWLILSENCLEELPDTIGECAELEKFALAGNRLRKIPESLVNCTKLGLLRLGANNFTKALPSWLFTLPNLAWYGDSGNPFCAGLTPDVSPLAIERSNISYGERIGGSPTSEVFRGKLLNSDRAVAIKDYKGILTSDGYAVDDMRASIAVGRHPCIIEVLGKISPSLEGRDSLVLALLPERFRALGLPPSLDTCSRDTFSSGTQLAIPFVLQVLQDISAAMSHLHEQGITHGDLYAHNILSDRAGHSILGDFGAASFIGPNEDYRFKVEVKSFGYLMDDLMRLIPNHEKSEIFSEISDLRATCLNPDVKSRPTAKEIESQLSRLNCAM